MGIMAEIGVFSTVAIVLWWTSRMDVWKILCISAAASSLISLPIMLQIERWIEDGRKQ
jgi:hypothetical protein